MFTLWRNRHLQNITTALGKQVTRVEESRRRTKKKKDSASRREEICTLENEPEDSPIGSNYAFDINKFPTVFYYAVLI